MLSLAHLSLIAAPPDRLIRLAAGAGFRLVDLRLSPATPADPVYTAGERLAVCRSLLPLLRDAGLAVWDVEIIRINETIRPDDHLPLLEAAALLGARRIKAVCDSEDAGLCADLLARLADLAAPFGLTVDLEYMIFSGVKSLRAALAIVRAADRPNLQVLVDALHWMRAGDTISDLLAAPAGSFGYVQLCDGPLAAPSGRAALIDEARTKRLAPGEGEFPLAALLDTMPPRCVASIEVPLPPGADPAAHAHHLFQSGSALRKTAETAS